MEAVAGISKKSQWTIIVLLLVLVINIFSETSAEAARRRRRGGGGKRRGGAGRVVARRRGGRINRFNNFANNDFFDQVNALAALSQAGAAFGGFNNGLLDPSLNQFAGAGNFGLGFDQNAALALQLQAGGLGGGFQGQFGFTPLSRNLARRSDGRVFEIGANAQFNNGQLVNPQQAIGTEILAMQNTGQLITGERAIRAETQADIRAFNSGEKMSSVYSPRGESEQVAQAAPSQDNVVSLRNRSSGL